MSLMPCGMRIFISARTDLRFLSEELMITETPLLEITDVHVERDLTTILRNFSWRVSPGEHWIVFGPNGAGKSTVLNMALGYLWPTSGTVHLLGHRLGQVDLRDLRRSVAVVSDTVRGMINPHLTAYETILTGPRAQLNLFDDPTPEERALARDIVEATQLPRALLNRPYCVLSTGERQRVLIARALMSRPRLLILDEPCAGLDLAGREFILRTIRQAAALPSPPAILLTTHHVEEITPDFTHALLLKKGEIHATGPMEEVFTSENLSSLFEMALRLKQTDGRYTAASVD